MPMNIEFDMAAAKRRSPRVLNCCYNRGHYIALEGEGPGLSAAEGYRCLQPCLDPNYACSHVERLNMQRHTLELQQKILEMLQAEVRS